MSKTKPTFNKSFMMANKKAAEFWANDPIAQSFERHPNTENVKMHYGDLKLIVFAMVRRAIQTKRKKASNGKV